MLSPSIKAKQIFTLIGAVTAWIAVALQLYLIILNRTYSVPETIIRFFSYFTVLTNIIVAVCLTFLLAKKPSGIGIFFTKQKTIAAIASYITVVGLVYNIILRSLWDPQGLQLVVNELLHSFIPVFFVIYWLVFVPKNELQWKNVFSWLIYPFVYLVFVLFRGASSGFYPYPFIDVTNLGYNKVFVNCGILFIIFLLFSLLFVAMGKMRGTRDKKTQ